MRQSVGPCPARRKHVSAAVIDPPVTPEERLDDALAAFGLLCDRAIEYLDLLGWNGILDVESPGSSG